MNIQQTVNQDAVEKVLLRQIYPRDEEVVDSEEENAYGELPTCKSCSQADQDLIKLLNTPPIEVAHRNYVGKHKNGRLEKEESTVKTITSISEGQIKKARINPDIKRIEFIRIAKTVTDIDEELLKGVEEVWSALGPLLIECDDREKEELLKEMEHSLLKKMDVQRLERNHYNADNQTAAFYFARGLSAELDRKYDGLLDEMKAKMNKDFSYAVECLLKEYEDRNRFEIEWYRNESIEKYQERVRGCLLSSKQARQNIVWFSSASRIFTQFCNLWMKVMDSAEKRSHLTEKQLVLKDRRLIADVQDMEEMRILKSIAALNMDHEMIETSLADLLYKRDQAIIRLKENVEELQKKVDIWKNLVNDLLTQFQKFVTFGLNEQPVQTQYLLSLNELYNQFLDDYLQAERKVAAQATRKLAVERVRALYPTCGPPDRLSNASSTTPDSTSTVDTETEKPECLIPEYLMTAITTGVFTSKPPSYDELVYRREQEVEAVVQTFGYEPSDNSTWDTQSTENFKEVLASATSPPKTTLEMQEDCAYMDESTKTKVDVVLSLMHERPELMKGYITL